MIFRTTLQVLFRLMLVLAMLTGTGPAAGAAVDYLLEQQLQRRLELASGGDPEAEYEVGDMYLKGRGAYVDYTQALLWFRRAAKFGHTKAEFKLGYMYLRGMGVPQDSARAFALFSASAGKGYPPAQFYLAQMYALGQGVDRSSVLALEWLTRSLQGGYRPHAEELRKIRRMLDTIMHRTEQPRN